MFYHTNIQNPNGVVFCAGMQCDLYQQLKQRVISQGDDFDPMCDPAKPRKVTFEDCSAAAFRIKSGIIKTPCLKSHITGQSQINLYFKCEFMQHTGSFKERGARNSIMLLDDGVKAKGVIAASLGNHSQGMSYHGGILNVPVTVVMPVVAPLSKIEKCRQYGANVIIKGENMTESKHIAMGIAKEKSLTYINGYDHPHIIAGQGTVGLEILEQMPDVEAVLVPCGGGGLLAGIAIVIKHLAPAVLVYGVETDKCASMSAALQKGEPTPTDISSTLADGLAVSIVGYNSFYNVKPILDKMVVVSEDWAARAILRIVELEKFVVEGGGAVTTAAVISGLVPELSGKKVVCVLSGGNIDTSLLSRCLDRGLAAEQRLVKFKVNIAYRPGSIADLCTLIANTGGSLQEISKEQAWLRGNIFKVRVKVVCKLRGPQHLLELRDAISTNYNESYFMPLDSSTGERMTHPEAAVPKMKGTKKTEK